MKQGKIWGTTEEIFSTGNVSVHVLHIEAGGFSSEHLHQAKSNHFYVVAGRIEVWQSNDMTDLTELGPGESTMILPGTWHKFRAVDPSIVIETYETRLSEDIQRRSQGGR